MVLEQVSHEVEMTQKENLKDSTEPYGYVAQLTILRCMKGISMAAFNKENKEIAGKIMTIASDNYPELMAKCFIVNSPWFFPPIFAFAKLFLAAKTVSKISVMGHDFLSKITHEVPLACVPDFLGGSMTVYNDAFHFDFSENGPLWCSSMSKVSEAEPSELSPTPAPAPVVAEAPVVTSDVANHDTHKVATEDALQTDKSDKPVATEAAAPVHTPTSHHEELPPPPDAIASADAVAPPSAGAHEAST